MSTEGINIQHYTAAELLSPNNKSLLAEIEAIVASPFENDHCAKFVLSSFCDEEYIPALEAWYSFLVRCSLHCGATVEVVRSEPTSPTIASRPTQSRVKIPPESRIQAVAILIPPGRYGEFGSPITVWRARLITTLRKIGLSTMIHILRDLVAPMEKVENRIFPTKEDKKSYWTLMFLATHPSAQCQGLGTKLLHEVQRQIRDDKEKRQNLMPRSLYLEASSEGAHRLYQRVGFEDREVMIYGKLKDGEDFSVDEKGRTVGGKIFPMIWTS